MSYIRISHTSQKNFVNFFQLFLRELHVLLRLEILFNLLHLAGANNQRGHLRIAQIPCKSHLGKALPSSLSNRVKLFGLLHLFLRDPVPSQENAVSVGAGVLRNAVKVAVCQKPLCE